jgi:hypothetical protein
MLTANGGGVQQYELDGDVLFHLDRSGNRITGDLAGFYVLSRQLPSVAK